MNRFSRIVVSLSLAGAATLAWADFPEKPVTLIVPFAAGGPSDKIARDLAEALRKPLGQTVIVDNTGGAGGTPAMASSVDISSVSSGSSVVFFVSTHAPDGRNNG